jgi:hypothetical protein
MTAHKYQTGQYVTVLKRLFQPAPAGRYQIVRQLPPQGIDNQYRIKHTEDQHERVVRESELG